MTTSTRTTIRAAAAATTLALAAIALSVAAPAEAAPPLAAGHGCQQVSLTGVGQDLGGGHTQATLSADGVPVATTEAFFTAGEVTGSVLPFTGPITLTPVKGPGTLTAQVSGAFDLASGRFRATSTSLSGTKVLKKVTGELTLDGVQDAAGGFTETVTGQLCR